MNRSLLLVLSLLFLACAGDLSAQWLTHRQGEILVQLAPGVDPARWARQFPELEPPTLVSRPTDIYAYRFDHTRHDESDLLARVRRHAQVTNAQFNHFVTLRGVPNDSLFTRQWQYLNTGQDGGTPDADLDIETAWDVTTGGVTYTGDTVVVCIIDNGVDSDHPDLAANLWRNRLEIPANNIDDDGNGYVDDYRGWSTVSDDDRIEGGAHGTSVAGIVGARGNNLIGVAGVNWNVKLMIVRNNFNTLESEVLAAYSYPLEQRKRYNATRGAEGAFVVATNSSWGLNFGRPEASPLWCAFYDTLGVHGIINVAATINDNVDVDADGDLPTACPSDYLLTVTNLDRMNRKVSSSGFGALSIDLGAYGEGVYTVRGNGNYGSFEGTSAAAPHVAGTVGLLYSAPCPALMALSQSDPGAAALLVKQVILESATPVQDLAGITRTGGRLHVGDAMARLLALCDDCLPPTSLSVTSLDATNAALHWVTNDSITGVDLRWRALGETEWIVASGTESPLMLNDLLACTDYEFQLNARCRTESTGYGASTIFRTDGCCELPAEVELTQVTENNAVITWSPVLAAERYVFLYRPAGTEAWTTINRGNTFALLNDLQPCTRYEYTLATDCDTSSTAFLPAAEFLTRGCGACLDLTYCQPSGLSTDEEWIASVNIGNIVVNTSEGGSGYADFGTMEDTQPLEQGATYPVHLLPGFAGVAYAEGFKVWIDLDQNGSFTTNEVLFEGTSNTGEAASGTLTVPEDTPLGATRLRVVMQYQAVDNACPFSNEQGEAEDYCINIIAPQACAAPVNAFLSPAGATAIRLNWALVGAADGYRVRYRQVGAATWQEVETQELSLVVEDLVGCEQYEAEIRSVCGDTPSGTAAALRFSNCTTNAGEPLAPDEDWKLYPLPARDVVWLEWSGPRPRSEMRVRLFDATGRLLREQSWWPAGAGQQLALPVAELPAGTYWVQLSDAIRQPVSKYLLVGR